MRIISKKLVIEELEKLIRRIDYIKTLHGYHPDFNDWRKDVEMYLAFVYKDKQSKIRDFSHIEFFSPVFSEVVKDRERYIDGMNAARDMLNLYLEDIKLNWPEDKLTVKIASMEKSIENFVFSHYIAASVVIILAFMYIVIFIPKMI